MIFAELLRILSSMGSIFLKVWPYLLVSIPLAVAVRISPAGELLKKTLGKKPYTGILFATLVGSISPLCSCTVIPVIYSLLVAGVPLGAVMAFWIASPSMDVEILFLSAGSLGWPLAIWRFASTFALSLLAGVITHILFTKGFFKEGILKKEPEKILKTEEKLFVEEKLKPVSSQQKVSPLFLKTVTTSCCGVKPVKKKSLSERIFRESIASLLFVGKFMVLAYFLETLIILYLPQEWIVALLAKKNILTLIIAALAGIPLYTTNLAALGIISGLLQKGMNEGAAIAFLIAGPTTTLPAMSAVFGIAKRRVFLVYLAIIFFGAIGFGALKLIF